LFVSFYRNLIERNVNVTVELKNGLQITGKLNFVDSSLNFNLTNIEVSDKVACPYFVTRSSPNKLADHEELLCQGLHHKVRAPAFQRHRRRIALRSLQEVLRNGAELVRETIFF